ncbi:multicopper oxidase domain-containing protein [Pseudomonas sp. SWRI59]|uniref:Ig-like domain-containing protein n=2 Tax=Pseudomonas TaxID=286 RepID=UPI001645E06F|nr:MULTISPECIES: multicopper oxidase domain-containing protein [unclassified Pseudomonas]MBC3502538.1 multicopper oxidase domain-containing protein [Pseudomonas sp. SWRI59]MBC3508367.1 multicopper oxidase domain-containing protein [Pseudomonas sp. SWRI68]UVL06316.1 multicopper oxidase domain-containing protein [Pseudomonas sp. B21-047]
MKTSAKTQPTRHAFKLSSVTALMFSLGLIPAMASSLDDVSQPPPTDPSAYSNQPADPNPALLNLYTLPEANEGSLELTDGGYGDRTTVRKDNVLPPALQTSEKYPTNGKPSPLFGAQPFTQQLLLFEEFGPEKLDPSIPVPSLTFPVPTLGAAPAQDPNIVARSGPSGTALEAFLKQPGLYPFPTQYANVLDRNPWKAQIEMFLNRQPVGSPAEGRPPGKGWSHQRWNEFYPQAAFKTAQAGARINLGLRDRKQLHNYAAGEFAPGGLYYQTSDIPTTLGTTKGIDTRFHPSMPLQNHKSLWSFDGTFPPKLLMVRYGQPILMRHYNALPIDPSANGGFGLHTLSTHEHNGHSPAESDGFANAYFFPGQYYDYRWPVQLAGYDTINTRAQDPRAAFPCSPGETLFVNDASPGLKTCENGSIKIRGDWRETMSSHWFHDHMMDFTAQNVYKGNAAMMNYYSALDRGNEALQDGVNLRLPSGSGMPWGNRDYDVNLVIADKAWDANGQLWFNPFNTDGFLGDQILVNWQYQPKLKVRARSYRFRLLNGSVSRYFKFAVVREIAGTSGEFKGPTGSNLSYARVPFHMIANDGNIMEHAVPFDGTLDLNGDGDLKDNNGILPVQAIAERYDIIINFAKNGIKAGDKLYFINLMEHQSGKGPNMAIALADVLSEKYKAVIKQTSKGPQWDNGDPVVGKFLQLLVQPYSGQDLSMDPVAYEPAKPGKAAGLKMVPLTLDRNAVADQAKLKDARHREFLFGRSDGTDTQPWTIKTDGGFGYSMDPRRINAAPQLANQATPAGFSGDGTLEVWKIKNGGNGWSHPVHVHFEEGIVLSRDGKAPPEWEKWARKDVYRIGSETDSSEELDVAIRFREFAGTYMEHCHNTQHEDSSMLLRWDLEHPGQFQVMPTPLPGWDGVEYVASVGLPTFRTAAHDDDDDVNKPPVAVSDSAATTAGKALTLSVLANDTDPERNLPLTIIGLSQPDSGQGTTSTNGTTVTYTPPATVATPFTASFTYSARDTKGAESVVPATVSVAVSPAAPVDVIQVSSASVQLRSGNRYTWDLIGTTSIATGNSINVSVATTNGPLNLGAATLTAATTGARWRVSVTTSGYGPATPATATVKSKLGQSVTVPISYK